MGKVTLSDILHVAKLSNLKLTEKEIKKFTPQLASIVDFVGQLSKVDTSDIDITSQTTGLTNILREDKVRTEAVLTQKQALSNTKNQVKGMFSVPAILQGRTDK